MRGCRTADLSASQEAVPRRPVALGSCVSTQTLCSLRAASPNFSTWMQPTKPLQWIRYLIAMFFHLSNCSHFRVFGGRHQVPGFESAVAKVQGALRGSSSLAGTSGGSAPQVTSGSRGATLLCTFGASGKQRRADSCIYIYISTGSLLYKGHPIGLTLH